MTRGFLIASLVWLAILTTLQLAALKPGHEYTGGDFALYILHAKNIAEGRPYADTGYIYNPHFASHSPPIYPPLYPAMIAPIYRRFGLNFVALKAATALTFPITCLLTAAIGVKMGVRGIWLFVLLLVVSANWVFFAFMDFVLPDLPFTCLTCLLIYFALWRESSRDESYRLTAGLAAGLLLYLCQDTREAGLVFVPALVLAEVIRRKAITRYLVTALCVYAILILGTGWYTGRGAANYLQQLVWSPAKYVASLRLYLAELQHLWYGVGMPARIALAIAVSLCFAVGYWSRLRRGPGFAEIALPGYAALLLIWTTGTGMRYLIPVLPLYFCYAALGMQRIASRAPVRVSRAAALVLCAAVLAIYGARYRELARASSPPRTTDAAFIELCDFLRATTSSADIVSSWNPRATALFTGRRGKAYSAAEDPQVVWTDLRRLGTREIIVTNLADDDRKFILPLLAQHPCEVRASFSNAVFQVYELNWTGEGCRT